MLNFNAVKYEARKKGLDQWMVEQSDTGAFAGGILMPTGPKNYIGAIPVVRGVIYFKEAYSKEMRQALQDDCFEKYASLYGDKLTWLWRSEPPTGNGGECIPYKQAPSIASLMALLTPDSPISFLYTSGKEKFSVNQWQFHVSGSSQWQTNTNKKAPNTRMRAFQHSLTY